MKTLTKAIYLAVGLLFGTVPALYSQDMLAAQSPLDKQMEMIDSIALRDMLLNETAIFPAGELYDTWTNDRIRFNAELPDSFRVDLRGFTMPTTNTKITDIFGYLTLASILLHLCPPPWFIGLRLL